ncbi:MAG: ABC transporter ATP-binding protein [Thermosynechococcaceae cyanobacterium]
MQFIRSPLQNLKKMNRLVPALKLVWQSSPGWTVARVTLVVIQGILPLGAIYLAKLVVDAVTTNLKTSNQEAAFQGILPLLGLAALVTMLITLCDSLSELVNTAHAQRVTDYMQGIIHARAIEADLEYYENPRYYDTLQRAQQEAPYRPTLILNHLAQAGQNGISLAAMVGLLLSLHWGAIVALGVAAIPAVFVRLIFSRILYQWQRRRTQLERQSMYLGWMLTSDQFAKEIRLFGLGALFSKRYQKVRRRLYREKLAIASKRSAAYFGAQAGAGIFVFAIFSFIVYQTLKGTLQLGDLVLYYQALQKGQNNLSALLSSISGLYEDNLFLANLYEFLDLKPRVIEPDHPYPIPTPFRTGIEFNHVSFQYGTTERQAIHDVQFKVRPGEVVALVGENGSGKTTLIKLLCRLYDPTQGEITIDGINLRNFSAIDLRRQISVIFQDYAKYHFTALDNIWLGNIDLSLESQSIEHAASRSGAADVIAGLPQGYNTVLGKMFDEGEELSIGQWQKIALARAFLRESQIIVLDEPTSAMDPKAEFEVFQQFRQLIQDQSAILISHRLSTVKLADYIYVMGQGTIIEHGTHDGLMALNGTYAHLFTTQAQNYQL